MIKQESAIGDNVKKHRKLADITKDVLSKRANLAFHTIAKIEASSTPDPRLETVKKNADASGVSLDDIMK